MSFIEEMRKRVPEVRIKRTLNGSGSIKRTLYISNKYDSEYCWDSELTPYLKQAKEYLEELGNYNDSSVVFIVSDSKDVAYKTAAYAAYTLGLLTEDDDTYSYLYDDEEREPDSECTLIDFENIISPENLQSVKYIVSLGDVKDDEYVFFKGMENEHDINIKAEGIEAVKCRIKFIHITKEQLSRPWVLNMRVNNNSAVWIMDSVDDSYYVGFTNELMKTQGYSWEKGMSSELFIRAVRKKTVDEISEEKISWFLEKAAGKSHVKDTDSYVLKKSDFTELELDAIDGMNKLKKMTGFKDMKNAVGEYVALAMEAVNNDKLTDTHSNLIFFGNPGTGKTTGAKLFAQILSERGVSSSKFNVCTRKDLIGEYVGHTAPLIAKRFEESRGGVLFVDEAGFFINTQKNDYTHEAMKEFIRYMEIYPDVTVIFAMYEREVKDFLNLDDGLVSRISRMIHFKDYSMDELWCIAKDMCANKGYVLDSACKDMFMKYMDKLMKDINFGNARAVRKLTESCIISLSIKHAQVKTKKEKNSRIITEDNMKDAIKRLDTEEKRNNSFGFTYGNECKIQARV